MEQEYKKNSKKKTLKELYEFVHGSINRTASSKSMAEEQKKKEIEERFKDDLNFEIFRVPIIDEIHLEIYQILKMK